MKKNAILALVSALLLASVMGFSPKNKVSRAMKLNKRQDTAFANIESFLVNDSFIFLDSMAYKNYRFQSGEILYYYELKDATLAKGVIFSETLHGFVFPKKSVQIIYSGCKDEIIVSVNIELWDIKENRMARVPFIGFKILKHGE